MGLMVFGMLFAVGILTTLTLFSRRYINAWSGEDRNFVNLLLSWKNTFIVANALGVVTAGASTALGGQWWQAGIVALLAWILVFTIVTDYATYKIPGETLILAYYLPLPLALALTFGDKFAYISSGVWFFLIALFFFVGAIVARGGIGFSDIRLYILMGTALSWWIGLDWMIYGFGLSAFIQLVIFAVAKGFGLGRIKLKGSVSALNKEESKAFKAQSKSGQPGENTSSGKLVLPFGPAIVGTFLVIALVAIAFDRTACSAYDGLLCL